MMNKEEEKRRVIGVMKGQCLNLAFDNSNRDSGFVLSNKDHRKRMITMAKELFLSMIEEGYVTFYEAEEVKKPIALGEKVEGPKKKWMKCPAKECPNYINLTDYDACKCGYKVVK